MNSKIKIFLKSFFALFIVSFCLQAFATWKAPTNDPVGGNISIPINSSTNPQEKNGVFVINQGFGTTGPAIFESSVQITSGAGDGKVLTSNASGVGTWKIPVVPPTSLSSLLPPHFSD